MTRKQTRTKGFPFDPFTSDWTAPLSADLQSGQVISVQPMPTAAAAGLIWTLSQTLPGPLVCITDRPQSLDRLIRDLSTLTNSDVDDLPVLSEKESSASSDDKMQQEVIGDRLRFLLADDAKKPPPIRAACIQGLLQPISPLDTIRDHQKTIKVGSSVNISSLLILLEKGAYQFELEVVARGQACIRGGILDCWPPSDPWPSRIEFFGDEVESIRFFDPTDQASLEKRSRLHITPATDQLGEESIFPIDTLPPTTTWIWMDLAGIAHHADIFVAASRESGIPCPCLDDLLDREETHLLHKGSLRFEDGGNAIEHFIRNVDSVPSVHRGNIPVDQIEKARRLLITHILDQTRDGWDVHVYFDTQGVADRFKKEYLHKKNPKPKIHVASISEGFQNPRTQLAVYTEGNVYGYHREVRGRYDPLRRKKGARHVTGSHITDWTDIQPGDFVVHVDQGIGRYHGVLEIEFDGRMQEVLAIEYADDARLYLPMSQTHLLSRYIGSSKARPRLHALGSKRWKNETNTAKRAAEDLASVLLEHQAEREITPGHAFMPDNQWQHEFEATFPYEETQDQQLAIDDVKHDMERSQPMDRLICGDVGFGKTEVAMRAAFKAVMGGKQVAMLVPTTVLARQHYQSFRERMAAFPVTVEMLSRFRTPGEQRASLEELAEGKINIMIGTHRIVQPDVRFQDLGLVIIDEEQRFGVAAKEYLKRMKALVDVLTLSATPIPRTLYMSMTGARDLSTIQTPPRERQPVETVVTHYEDELIRKAMVREINRGGQIYFLHNRVKTIHAMAKKLQALVPEASITIGHGQMPQKELQQSLEEFIAGDCDILLCTTIIESGIDISNVNTIIIDRADRFGVADLYQLRGRVGRFKRKAYAYLLLPPGRGSAFTARKRVQAIQKFSGLGAGFKVAMQDLEIRGAGNILGAQQSGHIAAVGFELYCQFLKRTIARRKGEKPPRLADVEIKFDFIDLTPSNEDRDDYSGIPYNYVDEENQRLHLFRRVSGILTLEEADQLLKEMRDRFGPLPGSVKRIVETARLRVLASERGIRAIDVRDSKVMITKGRDFLKLGQRFPRLTKTNPSDRIEELLAMISELPLHTPGPAKTPRRTAPPSKPVKINF